VFTVYDEEPSNDFRNTLAEFERDILSLNKKSWNRSYCELQYQYKEFIIWIEVYSLEQVAECPRILLSLYDNYLNLISDVNICTWIYLKRNDDTYRVYALEKTSDLREVGEGKRNFNEDDFFEKESKKNLIFK